MIFQMALKGIPGLPVAAANTILESGLLCRWWLRVTDLPRNEVADRLTEDELYNHVARYHDTVPGATYTYGANSPFISLSAGTYQTVSSWSYKHFAARWTALRFATDNFKTDGLALRLWVPVLGRPAVQLEHFAEEVRDPHQYPVAYGYHHQGEVTAKIVVPPTQIERYDYYSGSAAAVALSGGTWPTPTASRANPKYVSPNSYVNLRDVV